MCGEPSSRKNFGIFCLLARLFPAYDFIWIGAEKTSHADNLLLVEYTPDPFLMMRLTPASTFWNLGRLYG
jgi:hypothetical protein